MCNTTLVSLLILVELVDKDSSSYECPNDTEEGEEAEESAKSKPACSGIRDILTDFEVQLIKVVVSAGSSFHVVYDAAVFEASTLVRPSISRCFFINFECNGDANTLDHIVPVADATARCLALHKDGVGLAVVGIGRLLRVLAPERKVEAILGIGLLPAELGVRGQVAGGHVLNRVVLVKDLLISFGTPVEVQAEGFGIAQRHGILSEEHVGEVILHVVGSVVL